MKNLALIGFFAATLGAGLSTGCAIHAKQLAEVPINTAQRLSPAQRTQKTILVVPFTDERGPDYTRISPTNLIPVVHWFHQARQFYYPEQGSMLRSFGWKDSFVAVGTMGAAMPAMLTGVMRQMGLTDAAVVGVAGAEPHDYDYILTGRVKRTHFRDDTSEIIGIAFGMLGVPFGVAHYDLEYEVTLYDGHDRATPIFQRTYTWKDKRALGAYYNHNWPYRMFLRGFESTMPIVVNDVATVLAARPTPPPSAPQASAE